MMSRRHVDVGLLRLYVYVLLTTCQEVEIKTFFAWKVRGGPSGT